MTSISHPPVLPPQVPSTVSQTVAQVRSPPLSASGTTSPQAVVPAASNGRNYASATKRPFALASTTTSSAAGGTSHGKTDSISPTNGKNTIPPAVPVIGTPTIVNGNNAVASSGQSDHSRKASITITANGASGHMPNGGPVGGKPAGGNNIQFGSMNAGSSPSIIHSTPQANQSSNSLSVSAPLNPRINSPQTSPSPIPQPPASGGRPPSGLQGQGNSVNFGSLNGEDPSRQLRPGIPSGSLTPGMQSAHLRRESSQSTHSDMSNPNMAPNGGRGNYQQQAGRGRNFNQGGYMQQMPHSPNPSFRNVPNQPRGGQNMGPQYQPQGRPMGQMFPHSPHQAARSPALANSQPIHPQPGQMPMASPGMQHSPYGGYPQQMGPPPVKPPISSSARKPPPLSSSDRKQIPFLSSTFISPYPTPNLAPESGQFEQFLTNRTQNQYGMPQGYDPASAAYFYQYSMHPGMPFMSPNPNSPRPPYQVVPGTPQQQYVPGQYAPQPQTASMSRSHSGVSDRPNSSMGPPATPMTPAVSQSVASRGTNSPAPSNTNFKIPARKSVGIVIKDPNSGAVKSFEKQPATPAPPSKSPAIVSSTPTPPPRTPSSADTQHQRTESKSVKTDEEKINTMKEQIAKKIEADKEEEKRKKAEAEAKATKEKEDAEAKVLEDKKAKEVKDAEEAKARAEADAAAAKEMADAELADQKAKAEAEEAEKKRKEDEAREEEERMIAELEAEEAERQRQDDEREEQYLKKKAAEKEERQRQEDAAAAKTDEELKAAERKAEALEEAKIARQRMLEENAGDEQKEKSDLFASLKAAYPTSSSAASDIPQESGTATPASEKSTMAPPRAVSGGKKIPTALKIETSKPIEAPQPSAALQSLRSARFLTAIHDVSYPAAIASPNPALNTAAPMGKFRYDKTFLMQFQNVFVEKPSETWTDKVKETVGDTSETPASARGSARGGGGMMTSGRQPSNNRASVIPGGQFGGGAFGAFGGAGAGRTLPPGTTSDSRYQAATQANQKPSMPLRYSSNPPGGFPMGFAPPMSRAGSSTSLGQHPQSPRNPSHRGPPGRGSKAGKPQRENEKDAQKMPLTAGMDFKPIKPSLNGWKPPSVGGITGNMAGPPPGGDGYLAPDVVQRKVKAALNKMTPSTFDKISSQILDIVAQSKKETDGRTLRQVIQLTFEKATDEAHWAQMYAEFCSRMLENMSNEIKDETLPVDKNGNTVAGGTLFRKYLLNRCQQDFEAGWKAKLPEKPEGGESEEAVMLSDEYYIAAAAKRRGLGLVRFIGELFKLHMLTSRIMHMCVKRLVDWEGMPDEAEVESLTSLLKTIGDNLDSEEKMRTTMDAYFTRINAMIKVEGLPSRLRFMLMDIVDLRRKGWKTKDSATKGPVTLEEVRAQAAAAEREKEMQRAADSGSRRGGGGGGRMNLGRGDARNFSGGGQFMPPPDYQKNTVGVEDLRRLKGGSRQASSQGTMSFAPTSMFGTRGSNTRKTLGPGGLVRGGEESGASSRTATPPAQKEKKDKEEKEAATSANAFSALAALDSGETTDHPASPPSAASSPPVAKSTLTERQRSKSPLGQTETEDNP